MRNIENTLVFLLLVLVVWSCSQATASKNEQKNTETKEELVEVIKFDELEKYLNAKDDRLYVINFWATWCKPCIEELPYFEKINNTYSSDNVKVVLVSLDFKKDLEQKLIKFIDENEVKSKVVLLDETKYNDWIDRVSPEWSGAIPATLFHQHSKNIHDFYEQEFEEEELLTLVNEKLNHKTN